jgi:hypothetical protein
MRHPFRSCTLLLLPCLAVAGFVAPAVTAQASTADSPVVRRVGPMPLGEFDCQNLPGSIVRDDSTYETGLAGAPDMVSSVVFLDKFTPRHYPAGYSRLCLTLDKAPGGVLSGFDFNLVAYDDDGPGGSPGTLLGSLPATLPDLPESSGGLTLLQAFDIAGLVPEISDGSVYLGASWDPADYPEAGFIWMEVDSSGGTPSFGYMRINDDPWSSLLDSFQDYTHLVVRAVERAPQPALVAEHDGVVLADHCAAAPEHTNGIAEPGETVDLVVPVTADSGAFTGVVASLGLPAPAGVTYLATNAPLGTIEDGNSVMASFRVRIDPTVGCLGALHLPLQIDSDQGPFADTLDVPVGQPVADLVPQGLPLRTNQDSRALQSTLRVAQSAIISNLRVHVNLKFFTVGSVKITLTSPAGTTVTLLDRPGYQPFPGCENTDVDVTFADGQPDAEHLCDPDLSNGPPPWPVSDAAPVQPLALFDGQDMKGLWTLSIHDYWINDSYGLLRGWTLLPTPAFGDVCAVCTAADPVFANGFEVH